MNRSTDTVGSSRRRWGRKREETELAPVSSPLELRFKARGAMFETRPVLTARQCRTLNFIVAFVGLALVWPVMLLIAITIKLTSPGPVIYNQTRIGVDRRGRHNQGGASHRRVRDQGGRPFTIYKFRTMRPDDGKARQQWASKNDPRVTAIGRLLRATRLDELPQFFNVLRGDMNIVGPRPEQPALFDELRSEIGGKYQRRQAVLPGITGLAQVSQGYDTDLDGVRRKVGFDLAYIRDRSALKDLEIMAKTVPVMVLRKGGM